MMAGVLECKNWATRILVVIMLIKLHYSEWHTILATVRSGILLQYRN